MFFLREKTANTTWETESTYATREEAEAMAATLRRTEPTNDDVDAIEYLVVEVPLWPLVPTRVGVRPLRGRARVRATALAAAPTWPRRRDRRCVSCSG
jgi:hypothetical protein